MKQNTIRFEIESNNKIIEITAEVEPDKTLTRMNKPILCNCKGNNKQTAPSFIYDNGEVYCPVCGKKSVKVITFEDYENNELSNIHLNYFGTDYITLQELYKLSYTLPYESWCLVEDLFMKLTPEMVDMGDFKPLFIGWVTSNPEEVEERLNIKPELRVDYIKQEESMKLHDLANKKLILNSILEEYSIVETPELSNGKFNLDGVIVDNPFNPWNEYGGGEYFVIEEDYIWYVRNNSRDTDNHNFNNIHIKGSYGAIGKRLPYNKRLEEDILKLK